MPTITIPLSANLDTFISGQIKSGKMKSKAELVRQALISYQEDIEIKEILWASQEIREGKGLKGDLRDLAKKI